ncbi:MAG: bifunctional (p)ppGpp synthetase/guanosine-3',5'-bis(diphosphate) 3'-pyrophosphohydrolase [Desulfobulbaceae bacterium]|jgi:GTP pyrophosphokinase|nr:bifunctional (p)ppGpp synthetase/guanosine-3',5'-bis(diphosphate) 3'-pyrophosphohydrolase [Desulfobulbaceae bacterium]
MPYFAQDNPERLKVIAGEYLHAADLARIDKAWEVVCKAHQGQKHFSGEPYVVHALDVACTLAAMRFDINSVLAGLLHGVIKHGDMKIERLRDLFDDTLAGIVAGATKIDNLPYNSKLVSQAENVRKMLVAIASDVRVLLVRLVDRLQDMPLLETLNRERQAEIAQETMELYAPLASRLGIDWMKRELEDFAFHYLYPDEYEDISSKMDASLSERQDYVDRTITVIREMLAAANVAPLRITGRPKHLYSIYKKLVAQKIPIDKVYDKVAFRVIVDTVRECYEALGIIHANWKPLQHRIKDFISMPKANNYQSMHTTVIGPGGHFIEIQIRTEEMDRVAQEGVAAHWAYKEGQKAHEDDARLFKELKKLVATLQEVEDPKEFLDTVRSELFYSEAVYAITPGGAVKELPLGSCPIDFAYAVHTEVGHHCFGAKVNGKLVPLKYQLQSGDVVEILTSSSRMPHRDWLDLVKTGRARTCIRAWLRREEKEKSLSLGREICDRELKKHNTTLKKLIRTGHIRHLLKELRCVSLDDMLTKVGSGVINLQLLERILQPPKPDTDESAPPPPVPSSTDMRDKPGISITGVDGVLVKVSQCCSPVPGDDIIGFITQGKGVSIHKAGCPNLQASDPRRWIDVSWSLGGDTYYRVGLQLLIANRHGVVADVASVIGNDHGNILEISPQPTVLDDALGYKVFVEVKDRDQLQRIIGHLRQHSSVLSARRI